jgi:transposase-like protein
VVLGGRKAQITRPRVRNIAESKEATLKTYESFKSEDRFGSAIMRRLLLGISSRNYRAALEDFSDGYGLSKTTVSRTFVQATEKRLRQLLERNLKGIEFVAILIDGIEYKGEMMIVAMGITIGGQKMILGMRLGATENAVVVTALLTALEGRGLDTTQPMFFVLDGAKALHKAVTNVWGERAVIQRCQIHKRRNVAAHLLEEHRAEIDARLRKAYAMTNHDEAETSLKTTIRYLERLSPDAAGSLKEGLDETLTVHKLGLQEPLRKTLSSTNAIESCFDYTRTVTRRVKRWRDGKMIVRWVGCALLESEKRFNRVKGYRQLPFLKSALQLLVKGEQVDSYAMAA